MNSPQGSKVTSNRARSATNAPFYARVFALVYDSLIVVAIWMFASAVYLPMAGGPASPGDPWYRAFLMFLAAAYFVGLWHFGGQTVGMRAWRIQLRDAQTDSRLSFVRGAIRFVAAILLTLLFAVSWWPLLAGKPQTIHDRLARSAVFKLERS